MKNNGILYSGIILLALGAVVAILLEFFFGTLIFAVGLMFIVSLFVKNRIVLSVIGVMILALISSVFLFLMPF